jgi:hypothetical protein
VGESAVPGIPQVFSISSIAFTDMKFRSHLPRVTPSERVLVRLPLHVILSVEAAFASVIVPKTSAKIPAHMKRFDICDHQPKGSPECDNFGGTAWWWQWIQRRL